MLIGVGPSLVAFLVLMTSRPLLVVLATLSAFGWLASIMVAAFFRIAFTALFHGYETWMLLGPLSAALQEIFRAFFVKVYIDTEANVKCSMEQDRKSLKATLLEPLVAINDTTSAIGEKWGPVRLLKQSCLITYYLTMMLDAHISVISSSVLVLNNFP